MTDWDFMKEAIGLSRQGWPAPNPRVGCVIVQGGEIVGRGFHARAGGPHAEVVALEEAGDRARGADVFVTLEPCNHVGRTGPCSETLIAAGVGRVIFAVDDPNPRAVGGADRLRSAGIRVQSGLLGLEAAAVNERFLVSMQQRRPFVTVKAGMALDGRIALPSGESKWITGPDARHAARKMRGEMGCVLVGPGTVLADDPHLTAEDSESGAYNKGMRADEVGVVTRIVLDPRGELPGTAKVFDDAAPTLHVVPTGFPHPPAPSPEGRGGALMLPLENGRFPIPLLLQKLFEMGHTGLLVEGGGRTIGSFFGAGCVDAIELFVAPKVLGAGSSWVEGFSIPGLGGAPQFLLRGLSRVGGDVHLSLRRSVGAD